MIRFCDKEVIAMTLDEYKVFDKTRLAVYFMDEKSKDCPILLYDNVGGYYGMISYDSVASDNAIVREFFIVGDSFWNEAREYFMKKPDEEMPVFDKKMNLLSFCYFDKNNYNDLFRRFEALDNVAPSMPVSLLDKYNVRLICIYDFNECAWKAYQLFIKCGYPVFVIGEGWEWFGIKNEYRTDLFFAKYVMNIYAEGNGYIKNKGTNINSMFSCISVWTVVVEAELYAATINKMKDKNVKICKVVFPGKEDIKLENMPKSELWNYFSKLPWSGLLNNESIRHRQRDFYGEEEYLELTKSGRVNSDGWVAVTYSRLKCEQLYGVKEDKRIYIIGACAVESRFTNTTNTLVAQLQNYVCRYGYEVVKCILPVISPDMFVELGNIPIRENDICLFMHDRSFIKETDDVFSINLIDIYNKPRVETWSMDGCPSHYNAVASKVLAKEIFYGLLDGGIIQKDDVPNNKYIQKGEILSPELQQPIIDYVDGLKQYSYQILGGGGAAA